MNEIFDRKLALLFENHFLPLLDESTLPGPLSFQTYIYDLHQKLNDKTIELENLSDEKIEDFIKELILELKTLDFNSLSHEVLAESDKDLQAYIKEDPRTKHIIELLRKTEETSLLFPFFILNRLHTQDFYQKLAIPLDSFEKLEKMVIGEPRAHLVMDLFGSVVENVYKHYVKMIKEVFKISAGKKSINTSSSFGVILNELTSNLPSKYKSLIESKAGTIRNCAQHHNWVYDPPSDMVILLDENNNVEGQEFVEDLWDMSDDMYFISGTYISFLQRYFITKILYSQKIVDFFSKAQETGLDKIQDKDIEDLIKLHVGKLGEYTLSRWGK